jgi:malonate-semialdehyde dehydrogenase (acetylating)/methylmalonate-semialdehyde dehydrogenase
MRTGHFIGGEFVAAGESERRADVFNPATGEVVAYASLAGPEMVDRAVAAASAAFPAWAQTSPLRRARVMFRFRELLELNRARLVPSRGSTARCSPMPMAR